MSQTTPNHQFTWATATFVDVAAGDDQVSDTFTLDATTKRFQWTFRAVNQTGGIPISDARLSAYLEVQEEVDGADRWAEVAEADVIGTIEVNVAGKTVGQTNPRTINVHGKAARIRLRNHGATDTIRGSVTAREVRE